jgi:predicted RecB family nuclease
VTWAWVNVAVSVSFWRIRQGVDVQEVDGELVVSPTDLTRSLACRHLTQLDLAVAYGRLPRPEQTDETLDVLFRRGIEHEHAYLQRLRDEGRTVVEIAAPDHGRAALQDAERATEKAMAAGVDVVYQATFFDGRWRGHADFLLKRADRPGRWAWSYDVADTKLARRLKVPALLQMAAYGDRLTALQGIDPEWLVVVTGDREQRPYRYADCASYARLVRDQLLTEVSETRDTRPEPVEHCPQCRWQDTCRAQWRSEDHLSLVAFMRRDHARSLEQAGIGTVRSLGARTAEDLPTSIGEPSRHRLAHQARLQLAERDTGTATYELLPAEQGRGLALLPAPSSGDVFFDMEGDPFVGDDGLEYLFGVVDEAGFTGYWATEPAQEKKAFEDLIDHLMRAWARDPGMHVYHYAPYEPTRLKSLSGRYDTRAAELDQLLRGERLVDLYAVVRQGLRISKESYSLKKLEDFYWGHTRGGQAVSDALGSVVTFERWLTDGDPRLLEDIRAYNEEDCHSTQALRDWLEQRRAEGGGDASFLRPTHGDGAASQAATEAADEVGRLREQLLAGVPDAGRDELQQGRWLLAGLLDWHRRESLSEWWDYFRRIDLTDEELVDDSAAVGQLGVPVHVQDVQRSSVWRLDFPPQDTKLGPENASYVDPRSGASPGTVLDVDAEQGWLLLKRGARRGPPSCTSLVPGKPILDTVLRNRLRDLAEWVIAHGLDSAQPDWRAARDLLLRRAPRLSPPNEGSLRQPGESTSAAVGRLASALDGGVLPVQGPPGTGKTYAGARMVVRLLAEDKRVGICAFSHKVIGNLLDEMCRAAEEAGISIRALQKSAEHQRCSSAAVDCTDDAAYVEDALAGSSVDLVAGTSWLFAREGMQRGVDVLVVDEAGQLSLANVLAVSGAARSLVMLGDPQQLAQPVKGVHPAGAEASALEHLLAGRPTIPAERGVLLDATWRMHSDVAGFVSATSYEGLLDVAPGCDRQTVHSASALGGTGLRYVAVAHEHNAAASSEEADAVRHLVDAVLRDGRWTDARGDTRALCPSDVLVLSPYNAQVNRVRSRLGSLAQAGVRVGTVDKYQGQEAPVVIYTMASSSVADAPRGIDFLYNLNRFNVAVSRARAVVAVVCSPELLTPVVGKPEQLRLVNTLCRFAMAGGWSGAEPHAGLQTGVT